MATSQTDQDWPIYHAMPYRVVEVIDRGVKDFEPTYHYSLKDAAYEYARLGCPVDVLIQNVNMSAIARRYRISSPYTIRLVGT